MPLSASARRELLRIARSAIEASLDGRAQPSLDQLPEELQREGGAFVTLRRRADGELRGCVGYLDPGWPLARTVARAAVSAATSDGRFQPVGREELDELILDISVLGPSSPIRPEDVVVGRHGLRIEHAGHRGLLLPQVAVEWGWDAERFLEQLCGKAGLPADAWRQAGTRLTAFEADVFGDSAD